MKRSHLPILVTAVQLLLFVPLAWWVHSHPVNRLDVKIARTMQKPQFPLFFALSRCLSLLCSWQFVSLVTLAVASVLYNMCRRLEAIMILNTAVFGTVFRQALQSIVARPRPSPMLIHVTKEKSSKSFPSGHAATAITGWGWFLILVQLFLKRKSSWQKAALSIFIPMIVLAGPSRVYLGEHWTSDVVGGYLYGGALLSLSFQLYLTLREKDVLFDKSKGSSSPITN